MLPAERVSPDIDTTIGAASVMPSEFSLSSACAVNASTATMLKEITNAAMKHTKDLSVVLNFLLMIIALLALVFRD